MPLSSFSVRVVAAVAVVLACATLSCSGATAAGGATIVGKATVVDGDGLEIDGRKIRLFGIDAFESGQYCKRKDKTRWRCGQYATVALDRLAGGRTASCRVVNEDRYGRAVAVCKVDGTDLARAQVAEGWALAYRRYSKDYVSDEDRAESAGRGAWAGTFEQPSAWRARVNPR